MATRDVPEALTEPVVLAHAKRALVPAATPPEGYAVADVQFATESWLSNRRVDPEVKRILAPFNRVKVGTGYPDLVAVGPIDERFVVEPPGGDAQPLIAVEAKGYRGRSDAVDLDRGIVQAHDRMTDANATYLAAPRAAITPTSRSLAQDLNVGVLGVDIDGTVEAMERPRVMGTGARATATAIRFQATAQGVVNQSFGLNHPKNYLGYALAVYHPGETASVVGERVVGAIRSARVGARFLGLIEEAPDGERLTELGREVVRFGRARHGSVDGALDTIATWHRSTRRLIDLSPAWGQLARRVLFAYPATPLLVGELQRLHDDGHERPSLPTFVLALFEREPTFAVELFIRDTDDARERVFADEDRLDRSALEDGTVYQSPTVFQLKAMLFHAGVLTERGAEPTRLEPRADVWSLEDPL